MKEVKRYTVNGYMYLHTPIGNFIPTDNVDNNLFVTASDFDSIVKELEGKLKVADDYLRKFEREVVNCEDGDESDCLDTISADLVEALAQIEGK